MAAAKARARAGVAAVRAVGRGIRRHRSALLLAALLLVVTGPALLAVRAWQVAATLDLGKLQDATILYGAPRVLAPGLSVEAADLAGTLRRLGFQEVAGQPQAPGQFRRGETAWELYLPGRDGRPGPPATRRVRLELEGARIVGLSRPGAPDGSGAEAPLSEVELPPEPLAGLGDAAGQLRSPVPLADLPPTLVDAVLAIEDQRFFDHAGVDFRSVARAAWVNLRRGQVREGGSTITQQLVKNLVLTPRRTVDRKVREATIALWLERRYGKREILEAYLNGIYLGQQGTFAIYGVGAAARSYFGKDVRQVTLGEAAVLAGLIRAPNTYSPLQHPERARVRRDLVLRRMREQGRIDARQLSAALRERLRVVRGAAPRLLAPHFLDHVRVQVEQAVEEADLPPGGLRVYTTLDPVLQRAAQAALARGLDRLEGQWRHLRRRDPSDRLQGALVALDPATGAIRAMVGGRDYEVSQFNRVTQAHRQPGSAFKPFVYLAALSEGPRGEPPHFTPASLVEDRPLTIGSGRSAWSPRNFDDRYEGTVTVRRALEHSLNAATVWVADAVGLDAVIQAARDAGLSSPLEALPSLVLGSFEVTPLELAAAYAPFANGGLRVTAGDVLAIVDREGQALDRSTAPPVPAVRPDEAFLVTHLLEGVVDRGTGATARALGVEGPVAGKTGTTNEGRDAWFVGFTPRLVALVWVGFDARESLRLTAGQAALPIWADFMRTAMAVVPGGAFTPPASIVLRDVDAGNGKLATLWCPLVIREAFLASTEPRESCPDHSPVDAVRGFLQRLFQQPGR